jgi:HK97 gp10 family phage protein
MAADVDNGTVRLTGFDDLAAKLRAIVPAMRRRVLRNALAAGARLVRDEARRNAPVLASSAKAPYRTPGLVRKSIAVRTSKVARRAGDVGVFVNVKPAPGAKFKTTTTRIFGLKVRNTRQVRLSQRGAKSRTDPYYWRFLEFGTAKMSARPFLQKGAGKLGAALEVFKSQVGPWIEKLNASGKVQP